MAGPVVVGTASVGGRPTRAVHPRLHRLRPTLETAQLIPRQPPGPRTGLRRRLPSARPRPDPQPSNQR